MRKEYSKPELTLFEMHSCQLLEGSPGSSVYTDDPQPPGSALAPSLESDTDDSSLWFCFSSSSESDSDDW